MAVLHSLFHHGSFFLAEVRWLFPIVISAASIIVLVNYFTIDSIFAKGFV
jgi:hypothetical protein